MEQEDNVERQRELERLNNSNYADYFEEIISTLRDKIHRQGRYFVNLSDNEFIKCLRKTVATEEELAEAFYLCGFHNPGFSTTEAWFIVLKKTYPLKNDGQPYYTYIGRSLSFGWLGEIPRKLGACAHGLIETNPPDDRRWIGEDKYPVGSDGEDTEKCLKHLFYKMSSWLPYNPNDLGVNNIFQGGSITDYKDLGNGRYLSFIKPLE